MISFFIWKIKIQGLWLQITWGCKTIFHNVIEENVWVYWTHSTDWRLKKNFIRIALTICGCFSWTNLFLEGYKNTLWSYFARGISIHMLALSHYLLRPRLGEGTIQSGATSASWSTHTHTRGTYTHTRACTVNASWQKRQHGFSLRSMTWFQLDRALNFFIYQHSPKRSPEFLVVFCLVSQANLNHLLSSIQSNQHVLVD